MTHRNEHGSSTVALSDVRAMRRILAAGLGIIAALLLVLTMAVCPALADSAHAASTPVEKAQRVNALTPGQFDDGSSATVLVYLNGSDLESQAGEATSDIAEMLESGIGDNANVVIETLGTSQWQNYGIASDHTQRYAVEQGELTLVDDSLGQLDTTDPATLADFISWGAENYPADRYILVLWDHGAGPVYGFGYDEFQSEQSALTLDEMKQAFEVNPNVHFDIIGMDCCIMGSLETCLVLQPYCDYMVVSEDFEPGIGWSYEGWMGQLEQNPGMDTVQLGTVIVDDMIADVAKDRDNGDATLALVDESAIGDLYKAWVGFAYASQDELLGTNYSQQTEWRSGGVRLWDDWNFDDSYVTMTDYLVTDIVEVASSVTSDEATALKQAFEDAMTHYASTAGEEGMNGLGVTLPYGDGEFYDELVNVFGACGIDGEYVAWLEAFVDVESASGQNDCGSWDDFDFGFDDDCYGDDGHVYDYGFGSGGGGCGREYDDAYGIDDFDYGYSDHGNYGQELSHGGGSFGHDGAIHGGHAPCFMMTCMLKPSR